MKTALCSVALVASLLGCGSKKPATSPPAGGEHEMAMTPELTKFHDLLAPRWHADPGAPRMKSTCDAVPEFLADADAVAQAAPPAGADAAMWKTHGAELTDAVTGLKASCDAGDAASFEPAFARVHEAFHHAMAAAGGGHMDMHMDMGNGSGSGSAM